MRLFFLTILGVILSLNVFAAKPVIDCSKIRGVCYDIKDEVDVRRELAYGSRVGLNTVRVWLNRSHFEKEGDLYIRKVVDFVRVCNSCGYKTMPILFNGNCLDPKTIQPDAYSKADAFTRSVVTSLKDEPGLLMFDMMNEPLCNSWIFSSPGEERAKRVGQTWAFLDRQVELAKSLAPDCIFTVGFTTAWEIEGNIASKIDIISFHDYSDILERAHSNYRKAVEWGKKLGKQILQTETGCLARANSYEMALKLCHEYKIGWVLYNLIISGRCFDEHGIFYPDGTIRDAGTVAAMFGCFRNRGEKSAVVPPNPNREGKADKAIRLIRQALDENAKASTFSNRRTDRKKLLDACEIGANLLEACELVPMSDLPTAKIYYYRNHPEVEVLEVRRFARALALRLKEVSQIVD